MEARTGWSWGSLVPKGREPCPNQRDVGTAMDPGVVSCLAKHVSVWCRGHTSTSITSSELSAQLSSMDNNIKIKPRVPMCSIHCILQGLTGAAELGLTPYIQVSVEDKFSKWLESGAVLQRWTLGWTGLLQACFGVSVRL